MILGTEIASSRIIPSPKPMTPFTVRHAAILRRHWLNAMSVASLTFKKCYVLKPGRD